MKKFNVGIKGVVRRDDGAVLLLKKNKGDKSFWEIPGGRINDDESIEQTLRRELAEELPGIKDVHIQGLVTAHRLPFDIDDDLGLMLIYFEVTANLPDPIQLSEEHTDHTWVKSLDELELDEGTLKALKVILAVKQY